MADKEEKSAYVAKTPDRLEVMWQLTAKDWSWLEFKPKKPDFKALGEKMQSTGKPAEFWLTFDGKKLGLEARVGGSKFSLGSQDLSAEKDLAKRRASLKLLVDHTSMMTKAMLDAWDKAHPQPPDPKLVEELTQRIEGLRGRIKVEEDLKKNIPKTYDKLDQGQQEIGLGNWAKSKGYDRFPRFLMAVDWGRDAPFIIGEFIVAGAPSPISDKLKKATRDAILSAHADGAKPDFSAARKEIVTLVDSFMMPNYVSDSRKGLDDSIKRQRAELKTAQDDLKKLTGP